MKTNNQAEFGIRSETGEIYMLTKKERILTMEILKLTLATAAGKSFLLQRFGKEGINRAASLLEEMGFHISQDQKEGQPPVS
jgi:hypothetical protein